jgi:hypothetical protein
MNQDQVKEILLSIDDDVEEFFVIFSGKKSKKANGIYHPETREIIIHNRNFSSDGELIYTAIHEFAHHVHFTRSPVPVGARAHTVEFRSILHRLLSAAEERGVYASPFESDPDLSALTERIRSEFLVQNGRLMKRFGEVLLEAQALCAKKGARFEDYLERALSLDKSTATTLMKFQTYDISPELGYDTMTTIAQMPTQQKRIEAQRRFEAGDTVDMIKNDFSPSRPRDVDPTRQLEKERNRIQRTIHSLQEKLKEIDSRLSNLDSSG